MGTNLPIVTDANFPFYSIGKDTTMTLSKRDILGFVASSEQREKGLKDLILTIGIWTNMTDSIYTTAFSLAVRLENGNENDIYRVNSDQKVLCSPKKMTNSNNYRCLYVVQYDYLHNYQNLILYANSEDQSAELSLYANKNR